MVIKKSMRARLGAGAVLLLIFAAGFAVGLAADRRLVGARSGSAGERSSERAATQDAERRDRERGDRTRRDRDRTDSYIIDRIELTTDQKTRIDSIVEHYRERMGELNRSTRPQFRAIVDSTVSDIKRVLTAEQAAQYDSLLAARRRSDRSDSEQDRER
jgi:Spy/CpxP family protein refolding chaperone